MQDHCLRTRDRQKEELRQKTAEQKETVINVLNGLAAECFGEDIHKPCHNKCSDININSDLGLCRKVNKYSKILAQFTFIKKHSMNPLQN